MQILGENFVGFTQDSFLFPSLGNCQAIVYQTAVGMFGWHLYSGPQTLRAKANGFAQFIQSHEPGRGEGVCLYGAAPKNRFKPGLEDSEQKAELQEVADAINFNGELKGYQFGLGENKQALVEVNFNNGAVMFEIEDFTNCACEDADNFDPVNNQRVNNEGLLPNPKMITYANRTDLPKRFTPHVL